MGVKDGGKPPALSFISTAKRHLLHFVVCTVLLTVGTLLFLDDYHERRADKVTVQVNHVQHLPESKTMHTSSKLRHHRAHGKNQTEATAVTSNLRSDSKPKSDKLKDGRGKNGKNKSKSKSTAVSKKSDNPIKKNKQGFSRMSLSSIMDQFLSLEMPRHHSKEDEKNVTVLKKLSEEFQRELYKIQNPSSCTTGQFLQCGYESRCGLGCSLHHHMACLLLSYATKLPLLHNERKGWGYNEPWSKYFYSIGSNCTDPKYQSSNRTIINWSWSKYKLAIQRDSHHEMFSSGIPVPQKFGIQLKKYHENPFQWMIGQLAQAVINVKENVLRKIKKFEESLGISLENRKFPVIGMHVRRTDKKFETNVTFPKKVFMKAANKYRKTWYGQQNVEWTESDLRHPWKVFVASEDFRVLSEFRKQFPDTAWNFVGDESNHQVLENLGKRAGHLYGIVRDLTVLSHCDYVICTTSSNVCRILTDLAGFRRLQPSRHFKLLGDGGTYYYRIVARHVSPKVKLVDDDHFEAEIQANRDFVKNPHKFSGNQRHRA